MNTIQMYASSTDLRQGLHRVMAVAHSLSVPVEDAANVDWVWGLESEDQPRARAHALPLERLATVFADREQQRVLDRGRASVGLPPLDHQAVADAFRAAIISGRAHRAHGGRDVYGASNKALWDMLCAPFGAAVARRFGRTLGEGPVTPAEGTPSLRALDHLRALTEFDTSPKGPDHEVCVRWLTDQLNVMGFSVKSMGRELGQPLLVAHRPAHGLDGHVVLYGHYDVTPFGKETKWTHPPRVLTVADGRLYARGVADNKGTLACRLAALATLDATPELTWIIQGEEETGSPVARALLPAVMAPLHPTLWVDETGYHDHEDGTLRLLARRLAPNDESDPVDPELGWLLRGLRGLASRWGVGARHEQRGLNKNVVAGGCPFNKSLPVGSRYLAIGVNDSAARIHGLNESLPGWTFPLHAAQLDLVFHWAHDVAGRAA